MRIRKKRSPLSGNLVGKNDTIGFRVVTVQVD
jgi:hypothetical protein